MILSSFLYGFAFFSALVMFSHNSLFMGRNNLIKNECVMHLLPAMNLIMSESCL